VTVTNLRLKPLGHPGKAVGKEDPESEDRSFTCR
jgi:hypothetical protein